jgi:hypothetical protein
MPSVIAYEIEDSETNTYWEIQGEDGELLTTIEENEFSEYLDNIRLMGIDCLINTLDSYYKEIWHYEPTDEQLPSV